MKTHDSYEFITFKKLDDASENDRKFLEEFWLNV